MSIVGQRQAIAAAVTGTHGGYEVVGSAVVPDVISPLVAWPVWESSEPLNGCATAHSWRVLLALPPADAVTWDEATDAMLDELVTALYALGRVSRVEPVTYMAQDTPGLPCIQFTLTI